MILSTMEMYGSWKPSNWVFGNRDNLIVLRLKEKLLITFSQLSILFKIKTKFVCIIYDENAHLLLHNTWHIEST
jgi:hypothetical protein